VRTFDKAHTDAVRCLAFSSDGKRAASGGDDRTVRVWNVAKGVETNALAGHTEAVTAVVFSKAGDKVLSSSLDGTVRWWNVKDQKQLARLEGHAGQVFCVALSPDGKWALSGGNDKTVRLWSLPKKTELHCFKGHQNAVVSVQFLANGRELLSASSQHRTVENSFRRWHALDHRELGAMKASADDTFNCAAFSPDGRRVLVGGPAGFLKLVSGEW